MKKTHVSLWVTVKVAHHVSKQFTVKSLVEEQAVYKTKSGLVVLMV